MIGQEKTMEQETKIEVRVQGQEEEVYYHQPDPDRIRMYYEYTQDHFRKGQYYNLKLFRFDKVTGPHRQIPKESCRR